MPRGENLSCTTATEPCTKYPGYTTKWEVIKIWKGKGLAPSTNIHASIQSIGYGKQQELTTCG